MNNGELANNTTFHLKYRENNVQQNYRFYIGS